FEIVEEKVEKFVARQHEAEGILPVAFAAGLRASTSSTSARNPVAFREFSVSGQHVIPNATRTVAEPRLVHSPCPVADLDPLQKIGDFAILRRIPRRPLNQRLRAPQEALAVFEILAARVEAPIENLHGPPPGNQDQPACFTRMYHSTRRRTWRSV